MSEPETGHPLWLHVNKRCPQSCPYCDIAKLQAELTELRKSESKWLRLAQGFERKNEELQAELTALREAARDGEKRMDCKRCRELEGTIGLERIATHRLEAEAEINHKLIVRQSDLLTGVANALRGEPGELELHSHHDLPERAATIKEKARAAVNAPYDDVLDMGLRQALKELEEALPPQ